MRVLNYTKLLFLTILTFSLGACGDEYYSDDYLRNSDGKLCDKYWTETYKLVEVNDICTHTLFFNSNHKGKETFKYQKINEDGSLSNVYKEVTDVFEWSWINDMEGLSLDYIDARVTFENVWVRENYLSGKFDGTEVTFARER